MMKRFLYSTVVCICAGLPFISRSQDSTLASATLSNCVQYALQRQPLVRQSLIDQEITETLIKGKLADWYPQLGFNFNVQHYFELPTSFFPDATGVKKPVKTGVINTSVPALSVTQNIFNRDVLLAGRTATDVRKQVRQATDSTKINVVVNVSKAYYDVLLSHQQINIVNNEIERLQRSLKDAYAQYQAGTVDKTDYKRATIALNNANAQLKQYREAETAKLSYLKQLMNYPFTATLNLVYDSLQMEKEIVLDTTQAVNYENRIEYQSLQTQQSLLKANLKYAQWAYLPTVSAFANYNLAYQNDVFGSLYSQAFPNSYIGLQLSLPIFQGSKRIQYKQQAELQLHRLDWNFIALRNLVNTQYAQAISSYKSNLGDYYSLKENVLLAQDVYNTLQLQYKNGIKTYLDVVISENDLRTAQLNYTNALYQVLSSKIDVMKALGSIQY